MKARTPAYFSKQEQKILDNEIAKLMAQAEKDLSLNIDIAILYTLHKTFGFGKKRLKRFYDSIQVEHDNLVNHYVMPDDYLWLCEQKLKEIDVNVREWKEGKINE